MKIGSNVCLEYSDKAIHVGKVDAPQCVDNTEEDPDRHQTGSERKGEQDSDDGEEPVSQGTLT